MRALYALLLCFFLALPLRVSVATDDFNLQHESLIKRLQKGGYVVFLSHMATRTDQYDAHQVVFEDCDTQRNLSEQGRADAQLLHDNLKKKDIPIGDILASPYCRTKETADIIFEKHESEARLRLNLKVRPTERNNLNKFLNTRLNQAPSENTNTFIVSHNSNLLGALKIPPGEMGTLHIFKAERSRPKPRYLGSLPLTAWADKAPIVTERPEPNVPTIKEPATEAPEPTTQSANTGIPENTVIPTILPERPEVDDSDLGEAEERLAPGDVKIRSVSEMLESSRRIEAQSEERQKRDNKIETKRSTIESPQDNPFFDADQPEADYLGDIELYINNAEEEIRREEMGTDSDSLDYENELRRQLEQKFKEELENESNLQYLKKDVL